MYVMFFYIFCIISIAAAMKMNVSIFAFTFARNKRLDITCNRIDICLAKGGKRLMQMENFKKKLRGSRAFFAENERTIGAASKATMKNGEKPEQQQQKSPLLPTVEAIVTLFTLKLMMHFH